MILKFYNTISKRIRIKTLIISTLLIGVLFYLAYTQGGFKGIKHLFFEHAWLELLCGLIIYILVELKIEKYGKMPISDGQRNYDEILLAISNSKRTVRILENDFSSFFEVRKEENLNIGDLIQEAEKRKENLNKSLKKCLKNLDYNQNIEILLLHPNTSAAKQRHTDLDLNGFELFDRMNDGLQFLYDFKKELETDRDESIRKLAKKLQIKLFKTSFSVVFVSWDQKINFSVLPPNQVTDKETFKTLQDTPLAIYLNDNFVDIWKTKDKVVDIIDYKSLTITSTDFELPITEIFWGHDNYNHDLPIFFCIQDKHNFDELTKNKVIEIWHDGEVKWANVYQINNEIKNDNNNKYITLYDYAKSQIEKKSGKPEYGIKYIYEIKYTNRHRIMLFENDYVSKHIIARGYCYTPHNKYDVFLGTHLKEMLNTLYNLFIEQNFNKLVSIEEHKNRIYKRILVGYTCVINGEKIDIINSNDSFYEHWKNVFTCLKFNRSNDDLTPEDPIDVFLHKTIDADIRRILACKHQSGQNYKSNELLTFTVNVLLIQGKVKEDETIHSNNFKDEYSDFENKSKFTVLHSAGKKYIKGGMPKVYINKQLNHNQEPERTYNLITTLDSLYIQNNYKGKKITIESSNISFDKEEYDRKKKRDEKAVGYRNIIVIEFCQK